MSALSEALSAASPAVEDVALAIAEDEYPGLMVARYRQMLDEMAASIRAAVSAEADLESRVAVLTEHVYETLGFFGNSDDYYDPRNSYFNQVLERRTGIPISLAVVLMALGRRVGLAIEGVGFPGHFLVRAGGSEGFYLDPFNEGHILRRDDLTKLAERVLGEHAARVRGVEPAQLVAEQLDPVDVRAMAVRMLYNLQQIYERRGDHPRALVVCDRLVEVAGTPFHRRDRGIHALVLGAHRAAIADFEAYLAVDESAADAARVRELLVKARDRATPAVN